MSLLPSTATTPTPDERGLGAEREDLAEELAEYDLVADPKWAIVRGRMKQLRERGTSCDVSAAFLGAHWVGSGPRKDRRQVRVIWGGLFSRFRGGPVRRKLAIVTFAAGLAGVPAAASPAELANGRQHGLR